MPIFPSEYILSFIFDPKLLIPDLRSNLDELLSLIFRQTHFLSSDSSALPLIHFDLFGIDRLGLSVDNCCTTSRLSWIMKHSCVGIWHYPDLCGLIESHDDMQENHLPSLLKKILGLIVMQRTVTSTATNTNMIRVRFSWPIYVFQFNKKPVTAACRQAVNLVQSELKLTVQIAETPYSVLLFFHPEKT